MSISDFAEALDTFKEQAGKLPFAVYVDPITLVNTNLTELEVFGVPVKVSTQGRKHETYRTRSVGLH